MCGSESRSTTEYVHQGVALQFPCLRVDELVIWGLTYRMFTSFQELLAPSAGPGDASAAGAPLP